MAVTIVGAAMIAYVLFGGMLATTWVQIVKAGLLLGGAATLALLVLAKFEMNPVALFADASAKYGDAALAPVGVLRDGTQGLLLPADLRARLRRDGLRRPRRDPGDRQGRQHGGAAPGRVPGRDAVPRVHRGSRVRDHPGGGGRAHALRGGGALARPLDERDPRRAPAIRRRAPGGARRDIRARGGRGAPRDRVQGAERRVHGGSRVRDRGERELPRARAVHLLASLYDARRGREHGHGHGRDARADRALTRDPGGHSASPGSVVPAQEPGGAHHAGELPDRNRRVPAHL